MAVPKNGNAVIEYGFVKRVASTVGSTVGSAVSSVVAGADEY